VHSWWKLLQKCAGLLSIFFFFPDARIHPTSGFMACIKAIHCRSSVKGLVVKTCDFCPLNSFRATVQFVSHRDMGGYGCFFFVLFFSSDMQAGTIIAQGQ